MEQGLIALHPGRPIEVIPVEAAGVLRFDWLLELPRSIACNTRKHGSPSGELRQERGVERSLKREEREKDGTGATETAG